MKRIVLSIILGILLPFTLIVIIGFSSDYFLSESIWTDMKINGQPAPGILFIPFFIPLYLETYLQQQRIAPNLVDNPFFRASTLILFDWILYGFISYWILGKFKRFRREKPVYSETPPEPPEFIY